MWNRLFRNENIQNPVLFSKSSTFGSLDYQYRDGLGKLLKANRLKDMFNMARLTPSIQTVDLGLGSKIPVSAESFSHPINQNIELKFVDPSNGGPVYGGLLATDSSGFLYRDSSTPGAYGQHAVPGNLWADLSTLTVNSMYYAIMLQKYYNKASNGRRPVEFYANMFGVMKSNAAYDDPELLSKEI